MIEKLEWDSAFFGYPVGRVILSENGLSEKESELKMFRLIYLFSDVRLKNTDTRISEVDIKTTLVKQIGAKDDYPVHPSISEYTGGNDEALKALALESGVYSRFRRDPGFVNDEYSRLYTKWISDSINKKIADKLIVFKDGDTIEGFVSLKFKGNYTEIGLVAVDGKSRGKGVALALLTATFKLTQEEGFSCIRIVTQFANTPAMKLYQKAGFEIEHKKFIYHLWN